MPRPPNVALAGPGVRTAAFIVSPWQQARRGGAGGASTAVDAAGPVADDENGQSDADAPPPSPSSPSSSPAVSGGTSAEEEPGAHTIHLTGTALLAYYPPGIAPPPLPGVPADAPMGETAVAGRMVDERTGAVLWVVGAALTDAALTGVPADCSFSAGDRLVALGLYGPQEGGGHATAVLAQASGGDAASLAAPAPDGPRGREARALLCGAGCAPARGAAPRLRFECETLLAGPDAEAHLTRTAPALLTSPPPLLNTGRFHLTGWPGLGEGEAAHGPPPHAGPAAYGADDPRFDPELDGGGGGGGG